MVHFSLLPVHFLSEFTSGSTHVLPDCSCSPVSQLHVFLCRLLLGLCSSHTHSQLCHAAHSNSSPSFKKHLPRETSPPKKLHFEPKLTCSPSLLLLEDTGQLDVIDCEDMLSSSIFIKQYFYLFFEDFIQHILIIFFLPLPRSSQVPPQLTAHSTLFPFSPFKKWSLIFVSNLFWGWGLEERLPYPVSWTWRKDFFPPPEAANEYSSLVKGGTLWSLPFQAGVRWL